MRYIKKFVMIAFLLVLVNNYFENTYANDVSDVKKVEVKKEEIIFKESKKLFKEDKKDKIVPLEVNEVEVTNFYEKKIPTYVKQSIVLENLIINNKQMVVLLETDESFYKENLNVSILENGEAKVCNEIRNYKQVVYNSLKGHNLESHTEFFLALLQKESGCFEELINGDIAQSSESLGLPPNTITSPYKSIQAGVDYYAELISTYNGEADIRFIIHSYNFGERLIREAIIEEKDYTIGYVIEKAIQYKQEYFPNNSRKENEWRPNGAEYGDLRYVANIFSIYTPSSEN